MAHVGVSIKKRVSFRDSTQHFSNTYYYSYPGLNPSASLATAIIDAIVAIEKTFHSADVSFTYARCWSAGGTQAENQMITQKVLTGVGAKSADTELDRERAVLVQWTAGVDSLGRPVRLKKWYHSCGLFASFFWTSGHRQNTLSFTTAQRDLIAGMVANLNPLLVNGSPMYLVGPSGRSSDTTATAHKFLEHHQLGDEWRG